ncbi:hypothetical protein BRC83_07095 [Halobacteriales archaeon QS_1_68_17]|nr:MAG: hypothetical protein BRC83_07095 [Halobacteriales archaeon QS_1_68_17]
MNRRNVLIGLGALTVGGGAAFGSGAFSTVQADRTVDIAITSDANGNLGLSAGNSNIATDSDGSGGNQLKIDAQSLNPNAKTEFDAAFSITNNAASGSRYVALSTPSMSDGTFEFYIESGENDDISTVDPFGASTNYVEIANGADLVVGVRIETDDVSSTTETDLSMTIEASDDTTFTNFSPGNNAGTESS